MVLLKQDGTCQSCGAANARRYRLYTLAPRGEPHEESDFVLCPRCARDERYQRAETPGEITRHELIAELDRFFAASGVLEICRRCHEQGTGCCPPTCRVIGSQGCDPNNKFGKTVFCAAFICSALLNAVSECDPEIGRILRWVKRDLGPAEFRIYQMITRVPATAREPVRQLALPRRYPHLVGLEDGTKIKAQLSELADEVLQLRRQWRRLEIIEADNRQN